MSYEVGDKLIDRNGNVATVTCLSPFTFIIDYGVGSMQLHTEGILSRFVPLTELLKALV
jgi:hypothetical protein